MQINSRSMAITPGPRSTLSASTARWLIQAAIEPWPN